MGLMLCLTLGAAAVAQTTPASAPAQPIDPALNESVETIRKSGWFPMDLEVTFFMPDGPGPHPVAVINHGKAYGRARLQARFRPLHAVRYFLARGYAVVVPMRQGFSASGGSYLGASCDSEANGRSQAEDVAAVLENVLARPWANARQVVIVGQSHGGWATLAFGAEAGEFPGVRGLVNFSGGLSQERCDGWEAALARGAARYARETRLPSLWLYGDNDSFFSTATCRAMHAAYQGAGGRASLVAFGSFGSDSHMLLAARAGGLVWQPEVSRFLASIGLPHAPVPHQARFAAPPLVTPPPATQFAALADSAALPHVRASGRAGYSLFLSRPLPRAFAISANGSWGRADGGDDPLARALEICNRSSPEMGNNGGTDAANVNVNNNNNTPAAVCKLYAVDNQIVWSPPP